MSSALRRASALIFLIGAFQAGAQQQSPPASPIATTVVVIGTPEPVTQGETDRSTAVLNTVQHPLAFAEVEEYLRTDASTYIAQRGAGGSQADISIRGGSFAQTLVLLNGLRINDAETAHNNLDLPVPLSAMRSIDVLHGAGSTLYGSDAVAGVVDFLTAAPESTSLRVRAGGGNYGTHEQAAIASLLAGRWSELLAGERHASAGFLPDRDYRDEELSSETRWRSPLGESSVLLAADDRAFGADHFYGNYPSYERTKGWFASLQQPLGQRTAAAFGYRRHTDEYILFRDRPSVYENNHADTSWEATLRRNDPLGHHVKLFYGLQADADSIHSTNLGVHARNWGAGYVDAEIRNERATLNAGVRQEVISGGYQVTSPSLSGGWFVTGRLRVRAAGGYGFRLPTYLDLYYSDPTTVGNAHLKPESAWNAEAGADWFAGARLYLASTVFYSRQHNAIDYVRAGEGAKYMASNLTGLRFTGWESAVAWQARPALSVRASWTILSGAQRALHGLESRYVFNYPVNNASVEGIYTERHGLLLRTRIGVTERYHQGPYSVWDAALTREFGHLRPYLRITNLTNTGYQEVLDVQAPGRQMIAGVELALSRHSATK